MVVAYKLKHFGQPGIIYVVKALLADPHQGLVVREDLDVVGPEGEVLRVGRV